MKLLELFCGTKSITKVFQEQGHETFKVDIEPKFKPDLIKDIMDLKKEDIPFKPDVIWASPPCQCFSVASLPVYWNDHKPITDKAIYSILLVYKTKLLIELLEPKYWFIENPMGMLRTVDFMKRLPRRFVTYCQYGDTRRKPTDIWTNCNKWIPKKPCNNGDSCHESAPRGSHKGTEGLKDAVERAKIPRGLCLEILNACNGSKITQCKLLEVKN